MNIPDAASPTTCYAVVKDGKLLTCGKWPSFHKRAEEHCRYFWNNVLPDVLKAYPGTPIVGLVAYFLFVAIRGYWPYGFGGDPEHADLVEARNARRVIRELAYRGDSGAQLAWEALENWGPVICPWWESPLDDNRCFPLREELVEASDGT